MYSNKTKVLVAVVAGGLVASAGTSMVSAAAIIPVPPVPVIDQAAILQRIEQLAVLNGILSADLAIYKALKTNATPLPKKNGWLTAIKSITGNVTKNTFGETAGMQPAMNSGIGVSEAWRLATMSPGAALNYLLKKIPGKSSQLAHLATLEMQDSAGQTSMQAIGDFRFTDALNQVAFSKLEGNVQDTSDDFNTEAAQLNLSNAIGLQHLKQQRANNVLQAALLEQQLTANKYQRDATAAHIQGMADLDTAITTTDGWRMDAAGNTSARKWVVP